MKLSFKNSSGNLNMQFYLLCFGAIFLSLRSLYLLFPNFSYANEQEAVFAVNSIFSAGLSGNAFNLEGILVFLLLKVFPLNIYILRLIPLFFSLVYFLSLMWLVRTVYKQQPSLLFYVSFFFLMPPFFYSHYSLLIGSGYMINLFLGNIIFLLLYRIIYLSEMITIRKHAFDFVFLGLLSGLILSNNFAPMNSSYILFVLLFFVLKKRKVFFSINFVLLVAAFILGISFNGFDEVSVFFHLPVISFFKIKNLIGYHFSAVLGVHYIYWPNYLKNPFLILWKIVYLYLFGFISYNAIKNLLFLLRKEPITTDKSEFFFLHFIVSSLLFISFPHLDKYIYVIYSSVPVLIAYFFYDLRRESKGFFVIFLLLMMVAHGVDNFYFIKYSVQHESIYLLPNKLLSFLKSSKVKEVYVPSSIRKTIEFEMLARKDELQIKEFKMVDPYFEKVDQDVALVTNVNMGLPTPEKVNEFLSKYTYEKKILGSFVVFYGFELRKSL